MTRGRREGEHAGLSNGNWDERISVVINIQLTVKGIIGQSEELLLFFNIPQSGYL